MFWCHCLVLIVVSNSVVATIMEPETPVIRALANIPESVGALISLKRQWLEFETKINVSNFQDLQRSPSKSQCAIDILYTILSLKQQWALQMVDAFGKPQSGFLNGVFTWTGNYEECLAVTAPPTLIFSGFKGQFCWLNIAAQIPGLPSKLALKIGACLPNSCDSNQIMKSYYQLVKFLDEIPFVDKLVSNGTLAGISCVPENVEWNNSAIIMLSFIVLVAILVTVATLTDLFESKFTSENSIKTKRREELGEDNRAAHCSANNTEINNSNHDNKRILLSSQEIQQDSNTFLHNAKLVLQCFSATKNSSAIVDLSERSGQLDCIHGIRVLSITWVILGHSFLFGITVIGNPTKINEIMDMWTFQAMLQASFSVDSFFLLSGFLLTYLFLKDNASPKSIGSWVYFYVHRYIRLTPVYAIVLGFAASVFNYLGSGPFWPYNGQEANCYATWWWNLLYINNFKSVTNTCMIWTWYLANDMQFFIVSPLFLVSLQRWPIVGFILTSITLLVSWIVTFFISYGNDFDNMFQPNSGPNTNLFDPNNPVTKQFDLIYVRPYCRIGPYLIGILVAFLYLKTRDSKISANKGVLALGWTCATACAITLLYGMYHSKLNTAGQAANIAFSRSAWSLCLGWVLYACLSGHGGPVNSILSMKYFFPLSRLTYCAYLIHPVIMSWYFTSLRDTFYLNITNIVFLYLAFLMMTFALAFVVSLLFESPIVVLEKKIRKMF